MYQGGVEVKRRLSRILAAVAMLATGMASLGCDWWVWDEPDSRDIFTD